jgi:hypothetical protein
MDVLEYGLVGKKVRCPYCFCVSLIGGVEDMRVVITATRFFEQSIVVSCPECTMDVSVVKIEFAPPPARGFKRRANTITRCNMVPEEGKST